MNHILCFSVTYISREVALKCGLAVQCRQLPFRMETRLSRSSKRTFPARISIHHGRQVDDSWNVWEIIYSSSTTSSFSEALAERYASVSTLILSVRSYQLCEIIPITYCGNNFNNFACYCGTSRCVKREKKVPALCSGRPDVPPRKYRGFVDLTLHWICVRKTECSSESWGFP